MKRLIKKALALFKKPKEEVKLDPVATEAWPFPVETKKKRPQVKKATTRKVVAKKATTVAKKTTKAKKK